MEYDPAIITYQNTYTNNAAFGSSLSVGAIAGTDGKMRIVIGWFGAGVSLANGSTICTLNFTYSTVNGTTTGLTWFDNGPSCEYVDGSYMALLDTPTADYYKNGAVTPPLSVNFSANNLTPPKSTTVTFTDLTTGGATSWDWSFDRTTTVNYVNSTNSHSKNPQVQFTDGGLYTVKLVAHTIYIADSVIKTGYIRAGIAGTWTGKTSTEWNTLSNWDDYLLPIGSTDVIIPASALHWPVFNGNLILGTNCRNLSLIGQSSKMTITGSLSIP